MIYSIGRLVAATLVAAAFALPSANAAELPANLCSLLPASELSKTLGQSYDAAQSSVAPRPFANTAQGTDCSYARTNDARERKLLLRVYVDPSPSTAADLFARLSKFYSPPKPIAGIGDQAYFDGGHGLHILKGNVRFFISADDCSDKQIEDVASLVAKQL